MAKMTKAAPSTKRTKGKAKPRSALSNPSTDVIAEKTRQTETHIFFWAGPLSNWYKGKAYSGARALALTIERLDELHVPHPAASALSSRLLAAHTFICGEQWMMAMKGWLFERETEVRLRDYDEEEEKKESSNATDQARFLSFSARMYAPQAPPPPPPPAAAAAAAAPAQDAVRQLYLSTLCSVLRTDSPREQKALGRKCRNFEPDIWDVASIPVVVACSVARAEADPVLRRIYLKAGTQKFVEGSPNDTVWGVGIHWTHASIQNPRNWRGANRLGVCHDIARKVILENFGGESVAQSAD